MATVEQFAADLLAPIPGAGHSINEILETLRDALKAKGYDLGAVPITSTVAPVTIVGVPVEGVAVSASETVSEQ